MFDELKISKVLVIAPLRVASETWPSEIKKWDHLKEMEAAVITGTVKQRIVAVNANAFIYIVNRENVKWLVEFLQKLPVAAFQMAAESQTVRETLGRADRNANFQRLNGLMGGNRYS